MVVYLSILLLVQSVLIVAQTAQYGFTSTWTTAIAGVPIEATWTGTGSDSIELWLCQVQLPDIPTLAVLATGSNCRPLFSTLDIILVEADNCWFP